jgi:hypothetical protein
MMHTSQPQRVAIAKTPPSESAWRSRTALACAILAVMILGVGASTLDWSEGLAMALGQLAGMVAPLVVLMLLGWAIAATVSRQP